ncbi:MAG: 16S rRNA (guanine(527)-N(7))-methyltransferase RsmG [Lachnospiraceae bacterium]|nr:16S rRNA (guanine(527)-N(7))-methyltransferase RsmG [Lachnospiraceae bacterium]
MKKELIEQVKKISVFLTEEQAEQLIQYYEMLVEKNKVMNLTAITEWQDVLIRHFLDSLAPVSYIDFPDEGRLIDVGTGAGFPGIPLKIAFPDWRITLMDSLNKRVNFLREVIKKLGLSQIEVIHGRAEDLGRDPKYREQYDYCVSRAVANMATLCEYCTPFLKRGGIFLAYKSGKIEEELLEAKRAIHTLGCEMVKKETLVLPDSDIQRVFLFVQRKEKLSKKYPRKAGIPSKEPLGIVKR